MTQQYDGLTIRPGDHGYDEARRGLQRDDRPQAGADPAAARTPTTWRPPCARARGRRCRSRCTAAVTASPARPWSTAASAWTCAASTGSRCDPTRGPPGRRRGDLGAVDAATQEHGLAVTGGRVIRPPASAG